MKRLLLACAALVAATVAQAADLPQPAFKAAALAPPVNPWAGCFVSMEAASVGGSGISGSPGAGANVECFGQSGAFVYSAGLDMLFTKLSVPVATSSPLTASMDVKLGYAFHPGFYLGTFPLNDVFIYAGGALPASVINTFGGSSMDTGWQGKAGLATALSYTPTGQVQTSFGPEWRFTRIDGRDAQTLMFVLSTRMVPPGM